MVASNIPRLVIAAPHSHSGKTTVTLALLAALAQRGLRVAPFKVGPDYIDPQMHRQAAGRPSYNLDTYLVPAERVRNTFCRVAQDADIAIIEGVMGLFDGIGATQDASTAALASMPVFLRITASPLGGFAYRSLTRCAVGRRRQNGARSRELAPIRRCVASLLSVRGPDVKIS